MQRVIVLSWSVILSVSNQLRSSNRPQMASSSVSTMSRRYSSVFNRSGFLTAGSILEQRQDLNSILFSSPSTNSTVLLSEMSDLLWHQECYTAHLHGRPSRLLSLPTKRLQVLCWHLFVCENLIPGHALLLSSTTR